MDLDDGSENFVRCSIHSIINDDTFRSSSAIIRHENYVFEAAIYYIDDTQRIVLGYISCW